MINYISLDEYKKNKNYKKLSKPQIDYLNKYCKRDDMNELMIPNYLGKLDNRRKPKTQSAIYKSILEAINNNIHVSAMLFEITELVFLTFLKRLVSVDLIILVSRKYPNFSESYVVTEKTEKFIKENDKIIKKTLQEIFENIVAKTAAQTIKNTIG